MAKPPRYFGNPPPGPFTSPGIYYTPSGPISYAGGSAGAKVWTSGGGGESQPGTSGTPTQQVQVGLTQQQIEHQRIQAENTARIQRQAEAMRKQAQQQQDYMKYLKAEALKNKVSIQVQAVNENASYVKSLQEQRQNTLPLKGNANQQPSEALFTDKSLFDNRSSNLGTMQNFNVPTNVPQGYVGFEDTIVKGSQFAGRTDKGTKVYNVGYTTYPGVLSEETSSRPATEQEIIFAGEAEQASRTSTEQFTARDKFNERFSYFKGKVITTSGEVVRSYNQADDIVEKYVTSKVIPEKLTQAEFYTSKPYLAGMYGNTKAGEFVSGFAAGTIKDIRSNPLKQVALYGGAYAVGYGVSAVGQGVSAIPKIGRVAGQVYKGAEVGTGLYLGGSYLVAKGMEITTAISYKEAGSIFGVSLKDASLLGFGYSKGQKGALNIKSYGREEIPTEDIIIKDVLSGKKRFVESSSYGYKGSTGISKQKFDLAVFEKQGYGYHVSPSYSKSSFKGPIKPGTSEFAGLYTAPSPSVYFAKTGTGRSGSYIKGLFEPYGSPGVAKIYQDFGFAKVSKGEFVGKLKPNVGYTTGVKPEIEAVLPSGLGTELKYLKGDSYFKYEGTNVPLDVYTTGEVGGVTGTSKGRGFSSSSYGGSGSSKGLFTSSLSLTGSSKGSSIKESSMLYSYPGSSSTKSKPSYPSGGYSGSSSGKSAGNIPSASSILSSSKSMSSISSASKSYKPTYIPRGSGGSGYSSLFSSSIGGAKKSRGGLLFGGKKKLSQGLFGVSIRRRGKFKSIGTNLSLKQAMNLGRYTTAHTLGATFKLTGAESKALMTPSGFYSKPSKEGLLFIEKRKYRLSKRGERKEIQEAKRRKKR